MPPLVQQGSRVRSGVPSSFNANIELAQGLKAIAQSQTAAIQELRNVNGNLRLLTEREAQFTVQTTLDRREMVSAIQEGLTTTMAAIVESFQSVATGVVGPSPQTGLAPPASPGHPAGVSPASSGDLPRRPAAQDRPDGPAVSPAPQYGWQTASLKGGYDLRALRSDMGTGVARWVSTRDEVPHVRALSFPTLGGGQVPISPMWQTDAQGVSTGVGDNDAATKMLRTASAMRAARGVVGGLAEGRGLGASLEMAGFTGLARATGIAGAAVGVVQQTSSFMENQREQNAQWQSMMGGGQMDAYRERFGERMLQLRNMGFMGAGQSAELYRGVAEMGMRGGERQAAMDEALNWYGDFGMRVTESLELIKEAVDSGQESMIGYADALDQVTESAEAAGANTANARRLFAQNLGAANEAFGGGIGTTALARALASAQAGLGDQFNDVNFTGMMDQMHLYRLAGQSGMSVGQLMAMARDPQQAGQVAGMMQQQQAVDARRLAGADVEAGLQGFRATAPHAEKIDGKFTGKYTEGQFRSMGEAAMARSRDPHAFMRNLSQLTGIQFNDPDEAFIYYARLQVGGAEGGLDYQQEYEERRQEGMTRQEFERGSGDQGLRTRVEREATEGSESGTAHNSRMRGTYLRQLRGEAAGNRYEGQRSGIIEALLKEDKNAKRKYEVQTADGPRIVSGEEAMTYFRDQLMRGDVRIAEGRGAGQTLEEALGVEGDESVDIRSTKGKAGERAAKVGKSKEEWEDQGGRGKGGGKVVISPTQELSRWLNFQTSGVAVYDPGARNTPPPPHTTSATRGGP